MGMGMGMGMLLLFVGSTGCYSRSKATTDINQAWVGKPKSEIVARWGTRNAPSNDGGVDRITWTYGRNPIRISGGGGIRLPSLVVECGAGGSIGPDGANGEGGCSGQVDTGSLGTGVAIQRGPFHLLDQAVVTFDSAERVVSVQGNQSRWSAPGDANLRHGFLFGVHAGMGRLDSTKTALPGGGLYMGGMLGPRLGLVGNTSFSFGSDDAGGAVAFSWGASLMWWPAARLSLRAGPAMALSLEPGFEDAALSPAVNASASYALVRGESFVLDVRADINTATAAQFGTVGIGVNIN